MKRRKRSLSARRNRMRRKWRSRWQLWWARWRIWWRRAPRNGIRVPRIPRTVRAGWLRAVMLLSTLAIVALLLFITLRERQPVQVVADTQLPTAQIQIVTTTPVPTVAVTPTQRPLPTPTVWALPNPLASGGAVAFGLHQNGNSDIYILPIGQTEPLRLTYTAAEDKDPAWSPDGSELAFASARDGNWNVYVYNFQNDKLRRITNNLAFEGAPAWSPDGEWLAYESAQNGNLDIYRVRADGTGSPVRVTSDVAADMSPSWSPNGRFIAYASWRTGNRDIFLLPLDDLSGVADLSDAIAINLTNTPHIHENQPTFAPNAPVLIYTDSHTDFPRLITLPLTADYQPAGQPAPLQQQGYDMAWSPDGQNLLHVQQNGAQSRLVATQPTLWGVAPQVLTIDGEISGLSWSAVLFSPEMLSTENAEALAIDFPKENTPLFTESLAPVAPSGPPFALWELPINAPRPYLNDRVDQSFMALRERVMAEAGWDFLGQVDALFEPIDAPPPPGGNGRSWNKAGRAFDLDTSYVLAFEPRVEVVREDVGQQTFWHIYVRTERQDGTQGEPLRTLSWDFRARFGNERQYLDQGGVLKTAVSPGYYIDFTALATDYGWQPVPSDENWRTFFPGVQFWHFENRQGLSWQAAMQELYSAEEVVDIFGK